MKRLFCVLVVLATASAVYAQSSLDDEALFVLFPPYSADLRAVNAEQAIDNLEVFTQVARILLDNPQYRLLIDGHANPVLRTSREERDRLRPLSRQRAEAAATFIADYFDISRQRLIISVGGGRYPQSPGDARLNRRVSFVFITP